MKYYQIGVSSEPKIIGVKNGIYQVEIDKASMQDNESFKDFLDFFNYHGNKDFWKCQEEIFKFRIPIIDGQLLKKAKITDIMGYTPNITFLNEIYSKRYIDIIKTFNIGNHNVFEIKIKEVVEKYFLLFFETILLEEINYEKSILFTGHEVLNNAKYFYVNNYEEFRNLKNELPLSKFKKISIDKKHFGKDIIAVQGAVDNFYSERLIDFLLDCGITGLAIGYNNSIELDFH